MKSAELRERLGLSKSEWARALNVNERTITRWEDEGQDPGGLASEVMMGIGNALEEGADAKRVARIVSMGIGALIFTELLRQLAPVVSIPDVRRPGGSEEAPSTVTPPAGVPAQADSGGTTHHERRSSNGVAQARDRRNRR